MQSYILMLQTDADDRDITETVLAGIELSMPVKFLESFDDLKSFLLLHGIPALVLINENARYISIEIVKHLKTDHAFKHIPLIILTENTLPKYLNDCYRAGAGTVITKPSTIELTKKKIEIFFAYWLKVAELPTDAEVLSGKS
jgi:CheY-like chemotaxis protein